MPDPDPRARPSRQRAFKKGIWSERVAALVLRLKGYRILARRFRCRAGEIDLIGAKRDLIVFVEVKARHTPREAVDAVGFEHQNRIRNAADFWIARQRDLSGYSFRFDIIAVTPFRWPEQFENAF